MSKISIPVGTDLNKIIEQLNQERKSLNTTKEDFYFEDWIFDALPDPLPKLFKEMTGKAKKDSSVLAFLVVLSALIKDYHVFYDDKCKRRSN